MGSREGVLPTCLTLGPHPTLLPADTNFAPQSSFAQSSDDPFSASAKGKERKKGLPPLVDASVMEAEKDVPEGVPVKKKKKKKEHGKKGS